MKPVNSSLGQVIHANHGIFSRTEALDCGESDRSLAEARRAGVLVRLRRGMYAPADLYAACDDSGKHLLHARAAVAAQGGHVALTGASAAAAHGFALYQQDLSVVHLVRLDQGSARQRARTNHHIVLRDIEGDLVQWNGLRCVSPGRAVWEVACRSSLEAGVVTIDSALRMQPTLAEALQTSRTTTTSAYRLLREMGFAEGTPDFRLCVLLQQTNERLASVERRLSWIEQDVRFAGPYFGPGWWW